jgi:hypothetical protein
MSIVMTGVAEFRRALDEIVADVSAATRLAVTTGGHLVEAEAKRQLGLRSHARGTQTPSAPGSPPALITGTLRRSIKVTPPEEHGPTGWTISIGPTAVYGRIQELGGYAGAGGATHLPPRPYMEPALAKVIADGSLAACYATAWRSAF